MKKGWIMGNRPVIYNVWMLLLTLFLLLPSCNIDGDLKECPYNVRLEYWYGAGGSSNRLTDYINRIDGYLFDSEGVLYETWHTTGRDILYGELNIPPGRYTVVSWGNKDTTSRVDPEPQVGKSRLKEMQLRLDNPYSRLRSVEGGHHVAEKLYYNYQDIEVSGRGVTRTHARMTHVHCRLNLSVVWKYSPPANTENFSFSLSGVAGRYGFPMSGYLKELSGISREGYVFYPLPGFFPERLTVREKGTMNIVRTLSGELVSYRLTNNDHPLLSIYRGEELLLKELDLWKFFNTMHIDLDGNLRQEFDLKIVIDGDKAYVSTFSVGDWEDGGEVDGVM